MQRVLGALWTIGFWMAFLFAVLGMVANIMKAHYVLATVNVVTLLVYMAVLRFAAGGKTKS